jgi:putative transposase
VPHHLTQRGNDRRFILDRDADRATYLSTLQENVELYRVSMIGYCLMSNHVHLIVVPSTADGLAQALKQTHGRYATYWNTVHRASGHVWQGRYYSCPLDEPHLWEALRYTELNPLRAGLVSKPESWSWSSAASHCGTKPADAWLSMERWRAHWNASSWQEYLAAGEMESQLAVIRQRTHLFRQSERPVCPRNSKEPRFLGSNLPGVECHTLFPMRQHGGFPPGWRGGKMEGSDARRCLTLLCWYVFFGRPTF